jgi:DNA-binding transcriptional LysR family regulator
LPKSRLSKRVAELEDRLGVRLLQRTTRKLVITPVGERFLAHARAALEAARRRKTRSRSCARSRRAWCA